MRIPTAVVVIAIGEAIFVVVDAVAAKGVTAFLGDITDGNVRVAAAIVVVAIDKAVAIVIRSVLAEQLEAQRWTAIDLACARRLARITGPVIADRW